MFTFFFLIHHKRKQYRPMLQRRELCVVPSLDSYVLGSGMFINEFASNLVSQAFRDCGEDFIIAGCGQ